MSRVGRNQPCHCGSGRKTKRCCGPQRGPSEPDLAKARLAHHATHAARTLAHLSDHRLIELFDELPDLPASDLSLLVALPELVSPELAGLYRAIAADDIDHADQLLPPLLTRVDTPQSRARLADAVAALHAAGRLDPQLAAAAHIDLASRSQLLIRASLVEAAALAAGATRTPGGLLLAA
ncbi:MAG: YecA family protein [Solirubrobacteraceae bacterium]